MNAKQAGRILLGVAPLMALGALGMFAKPSTANTIQITCEVNDRVPIVMATLSEQNSSENIPVLNFIPKYFSASEALKNCQDTASRLQSLYEEGNAHYLTADEFNGQPAVCTIERRGIGCDHYSAHVLFPVNQGENSSQVLYDMLGSKFKQSSPIDSRTLGRIYTDIQPSSWWERLL
jgi:hypothetical protein